jgi:hypothetical protein
MTSLTRKTRTREHVIADLSINHVERQLLLGGCSVKRIHHDYGYDLTMTSFNDQSEIEGGHVYYQVNPCGPDHQRSPASDPSPRSPLGQKDHTKQE